jgi:general secretion pathway protein G
MFHQRRGLRENDAGFTLIELLIVIVILGVLAAVVVFAVNGVTDRGKASACQADISTAQVASEAYYAKNGNYATLMDDATHTATTLVGAGFLRTAPTDVVYTPATGAVAKGTTGNCS